MVAFASQPIRLSVCVRRQQSTEGWLTALFCHGMFRTVWNLTSEKLLFHAEASGRAVSYDCAQPGDIICYRDMLQSIWEMEGSCMLPARQTESVTEDDVSYDPDDTSKCYKGNCNFLEKVI